MHCMASKNLCGRNASLCACSSAAFQIYIWFTIAIARGGSGARARSCSNSTQSACPVCAEWVSWLSLSLSVQGYQVTTGPFSAHRERESAHLPSPSIHPSVRPQAATQTERPWPMAHTTLFVRAVYFSSTQWESREYTHARRKRENALTHSLWLCPFVFLRVAKVHAYI